MTTALITGITGQDGSYLAEFLLSMNYSVYGVIRRGSTSHTQNINHLLDRITLLQADLLDPTSMLHAINATQPDEIYNLAAQSHVGLSFHEPVYTAEATGIAVLNLLECIRHCSKRSIRFYQASSSEMFGNAPTFMQDERTPFAPRSPYGSAKVFAHNTVRNYRESYGMYACAGILFNHESPRRSIDFVTRKITDGLARIKFGLADHLELGNLRARRDWGFAGDYVKAMWMMLQQSDPRDYVIGTGCTYSVGDFLETACTHAGIYYGDLPLTLGVDLRPAELHCLCAEYALAHELLGWQPLTTFDELVHMMVLEDIRKYAAQTRKN